MKKVAIIGGTGVYSPDIFDSCMNINVNTPYGDVSLVQTAYKDDIIYFLERHGKGHKNAPHTINYQANIYALKALNVDRIFSTAAVGSMNEDMNPGSFVIIDQFLDFTKSRKNTFFDGNEGVVHVDMTEPYCPEIRQTFIECCKKLNIKYFNGGTYVCTEGPRFENKAEINMFKMLGGDVVGMTNCPEVVLAREANLCYATVAMVTNYATGISKTPLTHKEVMDNMTAMSRNIRDLFLMAIDNTKAERNCLCKNATNELGSLK